MSAPITTEDLRKPLRIWVWPRETPTGVIAWGSGCYRAEPHRPLDNKDGPTGAEYVQAELMDELITARAKLEAAEKLAGAAGFYAAHYAQDEAADPELCVPGQHGAAISLFNALAAWEAAQ